VLVVGVVSADPDNGGTPTLLANLFLDAEATGGIEVALAALGAKGGADEVTRCWPRRCRWPVCWRSVWASRATPGRPTSSAGPPVPRRALGGTEAVVTTLSDVDVEATVEG
jgi:leucyl aminopeptidase